MDDATPGTASAPRTWHRYVAMGDSFSEGLVDPYDGGDPYETDADATPATTAGEVRYRGWADRLAQQLDADARRAGHRTEYANLAVRGRTLHGVLSEQLDTALSSGADLVSLAAGGNDILRPRADVDALGAAMDDAVARLRATGADVLLATGFDLRDRPLLGLLRPRTAAYNLRLWEVAHRHGAHVLDLWGLRALADPRLWAVDRIHLSGEGHRRVALLAAATLRQGAPPAFAAAQPGPADWEAPLAAAPRLGPAAALGADLAWARTHLAPWVRRRATGRSSGDGRTAKRPRPALLHE